MAHVDNTPAWENAVLNDTFRAYIPQLPTSMCRTQFADLMFFKQDMANSKSFVSKHVAVEDQKRVVREKQLVLAQCIAESTEWAKAAGKPASLYKPTTPAGSYGGVYERIAGLS